MGLAVSASLAAFPADSFAEGSIHTFRVRDAGSRIHFAITVCTPHAHTLRFVDYLQPESGFPTYHGGATAHGSAGCDRYTLGRDDIFAEGFWFARMKVVIGDSIHTSRWRQFYIH